MKKKEFIRVIQGSIFLFQLNVTSKEETSIKNIEFWSQTVNARNRTVIKRK